MNNDNDEFSRRLSATLDRSVEQLDANTQTDLQQLRKQALASTPPRRLSRPALAIAASVMALILVPWLTVKQPATLTPDIAAFDDSGYLSEDPDMLADWDMLDAIGEVPDA